MDVQSQNGFRREFVRRAGPAQLCNIPRLLETMAARNIDGVVALLAVNQYYLSSFPPHHSIPETEGMFPVIFSRHYPKHPILMMADIDLARLPVQPTWIADIRPVATTVLSLDAAIKFDELRRLVPAAVLDNGTWGRRGQQRYHGSMGAGIRAAMADLGLTRGRVAFDHLATGQALAAGLPDVEAVAGDGLLKHVRAGKTAVEVELLRTAATLNQHALQRAVSGWEPGMTWHDLILSYQLHALTLGGAPNLPDTMAMSNAPDLTFHSDLEVVDHEITPGTNIMFDCHGKYNGYCWDGGKSWVVGGSPRPAVKQAWAATFAAAKEIQNAARPGMNVGKLIDLGLDTYRKCGVSNDGVMIFFHGLGLDHLDQEMPLGAKDWAIQDGMVISTHILFPGDSTQRLFLEEIILVNQDGGERLFSWNEDLLGT